MRSVKNYPDEYVRRCLKDTDCYTGWKEELRYLLCNYEEHLIRQQSETFRNVRLNRIWKRFSRLSVEHILPQSKGSQSPLYTVEDRAFYQSKEDLEDIFVHRLGNLLFLPSHMNSQLKDKHPEDKADAYRQTRLLSAINVAGSIDNYGWNDKQTKIREKELINWILDEF